MTAYQTDAIIFHLNHNIFPPLHTPTINKIVAVIEQFNAGKLTKQDKVNGITVEELFNDLKIETV